MTRLIHGSPRVWADSADYEGDGGARTHQLDLTSIANGAARQGAKVDLGVDRPYYYTLTAAIEMDVAPASGAEVKIYWCPSLSGTADKANPGGCSGADAGYTGTSGDSIADSLTQLQSIGSVKLTSDVSPVVQLQTFTFHPMHRYGMPVVLNSGGQALEGDADEMFIRVEPVIE